jgi:ABC-type dipeptide/oligopeptide/nickel transport system ATPase subunit
MTSLAIAVVLEPDVNALLRDGVSMPPDAQTALQVRRTAKPLRDFRRLGLVMISHDSLHVHLFCNRCVEDNSGKVR